MYIDIAAGNTSVLIFTFLPLRIFAAAKRSSYFAPVQEPMYALSNSTDEISLASVILSGENGFATIGSISDASYSKNFAYSASSSDFIWFMLVAPRCCR